MKTKRKKNKEVNEHNRQKKEEIFLNIKKNAGASLMAQWVPANAGDAGSRPGLGGSHMPRSNWAREPQLLSLHVWSLCPATREATTVKGPCTAMKSGPACRN